MGGKRKNASSAAARGVSPSPSATSTTTSATVTTKVQPKESAPPIATTTNAFATSTQIEPTTTTTTTSTTKTTTGKSSGSSSSGAQGQAWNKVFSNLLTHYQDTTPQRTKLIDAFMAFLVVVGGLQFLYCVLAGNYPFNAFLSGFSATVGQFVLTASLRIQTTEANKSDFPSVSPERAFADYLVCSLILHFFCVNFIN